MQLKRVKPNETNPYRFQLDVSLYWSLSRGVRCNERPPEYMDHAIALALGRPIGCSEWLTHNLRELQTINKARFNAS